MRVCRGVQLALVPWGAAGAAGRASLRLGRTAGRASWGLGRTAGRASLGLGRTAGRAGVPVPRWRAGPESRFSSGGPGGGGWRSAGSPWRRGMAESRFSLAAGDGGVPVLSGGGGWRSAGSLGALAGEGSGIRGGPSEFRGRPIARLNRIGNLRASVEEFLEFARRGSANGTPLEVDSGGRFSSASGGPPGPPWIFSGRCAGHGD